MRRIPIQNSRPRKMNRSWRRRAMADAELAQRAEITVVVRPRGSDEQWRKLVAELNKGLPHQRRYLTHKEFARQWGAAPADLRAVQEFGRKFGMRTVSADAFRRCVVLSGTLRQIQRAFAVDFVHVAHPLGTFRSYRGRPQVADSIADLVECVLGLDELPSAKAHLVAPAKGVPPSMHRRRLLKAYRFPKRLQGKGQRVAIIECGGGLHKRDYNRFFKQLGLEPPPLRIKRVAGATNDPASPADVQRYWTALHTGHFVPCKTTTISGDPAVDDQVNWTIETTMDLQIVGALAPKAELLLIQAPNSDQGQYHAVTAAIADKKNTVISCSWGGNEQQQTPALMSSLDRWFQAAAILGITVCYSSGDDGDGTGCDAPGHEQFTVSFPAASPYVLAVGGTTLDPRADTETAWNQTLGGLPFASSGGFSRVFDLPPWQQRARIDAARWIPNGASSGRGRGVPDVAAKADFASAFSVLVGGVEIFSGGTSAAVPLWGALMAVLNEGLRGRAGFIDTLFYEGDLRHALRDITRGNTGHFRCKVGWDPCTGWGSPDGEALLRALKGR